MDLNPVEDNLHFNFDFQVWRPSSTVNETGCYSLVGNYAATSISIETSVTESHVARVTPLYQLQFQPGDVLGFYVESEAERTHENNGVVLLDDGAYTSEKVWHASITSRTSQVGSCPYSVGTDGVLNTLTRAAPVISISTLVYSCAQSRSLSISTSSAVKIMTTNSGRLSTTAVSDAGEHNVNNVLLIAGAAVATFVILCISLVTLIIVAITVVRKRQVVERESQLKVRNESLIMMATDVEIKRDVTDIEVTPHQQAGTRKSTETKANPSYGEVGRKNNNYLNMEANPCYKQARKSVETEANLSYAEVEEMMNLKMETNPYD